MWKKIGKAKYYLIAGSFFLHLRRFIWNSFVRVLKKIDSLFRKMDKLIGFLIRKIIYSKGEVENNKILVRTYDCRYSCNPKYIVEEMLRRDLPLDIVWVGPRKGRIPALPPAVRAVRNGSYSMYHEMATAKVWIDNALNCVWEGMPKKKTQIYLNTWHGSLGIKRLSGGRTWMRRAKRCNKVTDFCITNSRFEEDVFHETFWPDIPYLRYGHARNDILFQNDRSQELRERVCAFFEIDVDTKILLYAPTFRDDGDMAWFDLDLDRIKEDLEERFGGEWCILVRMHYKNVSKKVRIESPWIRNASRYGDMQELLAVADAGITDYSSWAYDYILTGRPLFLYVPDLEKYDQERGFYYPLETTPFPIAMDQEELSGEIADFDEELYTERCQSFLEEKGCMEDGHACTRIVDKIQELIGISAPSEVIE